MLNMFSFVKIYCKNFQNINNFTLLFRKKKNFYMSPTFFQLFIALLIYLRFHDLLIYIHYHFLLNYQSSRTLIYFHISICYHILLTMSHTYLRIMVTYILTTATIFSSSQLIYYYHYYYLLRSKFLYEENALISNKSVYYKIKKIVEI